MKLVGKLLLAVVFTAGVASSATPAMAGHTVNVNCAIRFGQQWPITLAFVQLNLGQIYAVEVEPLNRISGEVFFTSRVNRRYHGVNLRRGRNYVIEVRCGNELPPERAN